MDLLKRNGIANCPVTPADIEAAEHIFRPDIGSLERKTMRRNPPIIDSPVTTIPASILKRYKKVTLCVDIMYVNRVAMLVSISRNIKFATIEAIPNNKTTMLTKGIKAILQINRKNPKWLNKVTKSHNVGKRLFSGFLVSFASGVVEWNCWMKQQSNHRNRSTYGYPNWLFGCSARVTEPNSTQQVRYVGIQ